MANYKEGNKEEGDGKVRAAGGAEGGGKAAAPRVIEDIEVCV